MSLTPAALHRRHRGRTRGHRGDCTQGLHPCHCPHPCHRSPTALQGSCSPQLHGEPLCCPQHPPRPAHHPARAHREPCWDVQGCRGGRQLLLGRSQNQRFQPQRAAVRLCRTTPCPVSLIPRAQPGAPAASPHPEAGPSLSPQPRCPHCGRTHGSDTPRSPPCLASFLLARSADSAEQPGVPSAGTAKLAALTQLDRGALTALPAPTPAPHAPFRLRRDAAPRSARAWSCAQTPGDVCEAGRDEGRDGAAR